MQACQRGPAKLLPPAGPCHVACARVQTFQPQWRVLVATLSTEVSGRDLALDFSYVMNKCTFCFRNFNVCCLQSTTDPRRWHVWKYRDVKPCHVVRMRIHKAPPGTDALLFILIPLIFPALYLWTCSGMYFWKPILSIFIWFQVSWLWRLWHIWHGPGRGKGPGVQLNSPGRVWSHFCDPQI